MDSIYVGSFKLHDMQEIKCHYIPILTIRAGQRKEKLSHIKKSHKKMSVNGEGGGLVAKRKQKTIDFFFLILMLFKWLIK